VALLCAQIKFLHDAFIFASGLSPWS